VAAGLSLLLVVPAALVVYEGRTAVNQAEVTPPPPLWADLLEPILVLPSQGVTDYTPMAWQAEGWPTIANGSSGFEPRFQEDFRVQMRSFPDAFTVDLLRARGIRTVVVMRDWADGGPWQHAADRSVAGLGIGRFELEDVVIFNIPEN